LPPLAPTRLASLHLRAKLKVAAAANPDISKRVGQFSKASPELAVCSNTMKSQNVTLKDLLPASLPPSAAAWCGSPIAIARLFSSGLEAVPLT